MKKLFFLIWLLVVTIIVKAQFVCSTIQNTQMSSSSYEQVLPKIATLPNGKAYISWWEADANTYSLKLQLIDIDGNKLWTNNLTVSSHPTGGWLRDYSIIVDTANNCILAFDDQRNTNLDINIYKISPTGEFLWGQDGITLENPNSDDFNPQIAINSKNELIICWTNFNNQIFLQRISPTGQRLWENPGLVYESGNSIVRFKNPKITLTTNDKTILVYYNETGSFMYPNRKIHVQLFDTNGVALLTEPTVVYSQGQIPFYSEFVIKGDNQSGCYIAWNTSENEIFKTYISHVDTNAQTTMPINGVLIIENNNYMYKSPVIAVDGQNNAIVICLQTNLSQTQGCIAGQKITLTGHKLWTLSGIEFSSMSADGIAYHLADNFLNNIVLIYNLISSQDVNEQSIKSMLIDRNGNVKWQKNISTSISQKDYTAYGRRPDNHFVIVWEDNKTYTKNIFYHKLLVYDLDLGNDTTITTNQTLTLDATNLFQTYLWNDNSTNSTLQIVGANFSPGIYSFSVTTTDECNFQYSDQINVSIVEGTNISKISDKIEIYPNPTSHFLNITLKDNCCEQTIVYIYDLNGKEIEKFELSNNFVSRDIKNLNDGLYYLHIVSNNHKHLQKFVKLTR